MYINQAYGAEAVVAVEKSKTDAAYNARINGVAGRATQVSWDFCMWGDAELRLIPGKGSVLFRLGETQFAADSNKYIVQ
jgi:hypothetical protein